ncbi:hypothetical protein EZ313_03520 [Ramlibacter henchirensis]|uniref:SMODS-associating 2TM beta-strand rich effector domain-containing protein n=1 Tax=Ramlibacter henchirensis TaxID=204072 RepID=A0A4Z0C6M2_9BURK|nr:hypothetical protein [Ramlibacter henchirensis]TFZ05739.1 hypothetical protein EZ313_03520 [Ramlibacter henchirensis]
MDEIAIYLLLGAGGALVATLFLMTLKDAWVHHVLPLLRNWRYRGDRIAGVWTGLGSAPVPTAGEWTEIRLSLEQQARDLRGLLWIRHCSGDRSAKLQVHLEGRISDGYVTLGPSPGGDAPLLAATALLKIQDRGSSLDGQLVYRDVQTDAIQGIHVSVHRTASMALPWMRPLVAAAESAQAEYI